MKKNKKIFYLIIFIMLALLCYLFPYTHDDYAWGTSIGMEKLHSLFNNYNGRWLGNLFILLITRSLFVKSIIMSSVLVLIFYLIDEIIDNDNVIIRVFPIVLFFLMPSYTFKQGVVWASGFTNYVIPMVFFLFYLKCNKDIFEKNNTKFPTFLMLPLGFACSLFMENITLFNLLLCFVISVYLYIKDKKINYANLLYFIGSLLGTILMFSNGAYHSVASGNDDYRTIDVIGNAINNIFNTIVDYLTFKNIYLNIILSIILILIISKKYKKIIKKYKQIIPFIIFILVSYPIYSLYSNYYSINLLLKYTKYFNAIFTMLYLLTILLSIFLFIDNKEKKYKYVSICLIIVGVTCPLVIVSPIGPRCFVPTYILFILLTGLLLDYYLSTIKYKRHIILENVLYSSLIVLFIFYFLIYGYVYKINIEREKYILCHKENNQLVLPKLPYNNFVYNGYPDSDVFVYRFKLFYNIDQKKDVKFVSIKEWNKKYKND